MKRLMLATVVLSALLCACGGRSSSPTPEVPEQSAMPRPVSASGKVVPEHRAVLGFRQGGQVVALHASEGQMVAAGQELAAVDDTELDYAVRAATEALAAQQAALALAQAPSWPADVAAAQAQLDAAQVALQTLQGAPTDRDLEEARLLVEQAKNTLWATQLEGNIPGLPVSSQQAARARAAVAEQAVSLAQSHYERVKDGSTAEALAGARAAVALAEASLERLRRGTSAEQLESLRATVRSAEVVADQAKWMLTLARLTSPLTGTVTAMELRVGEFVAPGAPVLTAADLDSLWVETTDLDEADLLRLRIGQSAEVTLDALPGEVLAGRVSRIADMSTTNQGGSSYVVVIEFDKPDSRLRWGMTAFVDILAE